MAKELDGAVEVFRTRSLAHPAALYLRRNHAESVGAHYDQAINALSGKLPTAAEPYRGCRRAASILI
jgi:hypothetical protein